MKPSLEQLDREVAMREEDLRVFQSALDSLRKRIQESTDTPGQLLPLHAWAGATGLVDIAFVVVNNMDRALEELIRDRDQLKQERRAALRLVPTGTDDEGTPDAS